MNTCFADEFTLRSNGSGPVKVTTTLALNEKRQPHVVIEAVNLTGLPIQKLTLCVASPSVKKGCLFTVWTTMELGAGEKLSREVSSNAKVANTMHSVAIASMEQYVPPPPRVPSRFDAIRTVYVDERFGGLTGDALREHVIGALTNGGRFTAVEKFEGADAIIKGRSDSQERAVRVSSADRNKTSAGAIFGTVITGGSSTSTSVQERVMTETISLRLVVPSSGEVVWAWDDTKPCGSDLMRPEFSTITKARCAVQDFMALAAR
jgi:hypothetical protein